ncbi:methyl-accepting chemotaxis protein [Methylococcus sp. EFPC2]|uniref:methyl-accepting chemotaxis protein n=1 Tax=Methylococcus sp. EFPC2 TaxID=2812648 RepID=UPI001967E94D|nr:methyl-accepting chemotaxis protein [Methylococcus sp. EFPC2]QSA96004.1 HAMP domain-containing protein [Methylococcus sp. EFPC2]
MKFSRMKIGLRLSIGFGTVLLLMLAIGLTGMWSSHKIAASAQRVVDVDSGILDKALRIQISVLNLRRFEKDMFINLGSQKDYEKYVLQWHTARKEVQGHIESLKPLLENADQKANLDHISADLAIYDGGIQSISALIGENKITTTQDANTAMVPYKEAVRRVDQYVAALSEFAGAQMQLSKAGVQSLIFTVNVQTILLLLAGMAFALHQAYKHVRSITAPLAHAHEVSRKMAGGDFNFTIQVHGEDEISELLVAIAGVQTTLRNLIGDFNALSRAALRGELATRAEVARHPGEFRQIVAGVNDTLDAVTGPLHRAAEYVHRIARGDLPAKITEDYPGEFNAIKDNLNLAIHNIDALISDTDGLVKAAVEGKLNIRADGSRHHGGFRKIVQGINDTLDAVIGPLGVAAEYVNRIAHGDLPPKIKEQYRGDFNAIKDNLNLAIDNISALAEDTDLLVSSAAAGKLDTRADASRHRGAYREIVRGINETLDDIVGPLELVERVLAALAKGDLSERIDARFTGTFATLCEDANLTVDNLAQSVLMIKEATDAINTASKEIASGNSDLSHRTELQASSLEETASSMEELSSAVKQNAENAKRANQMAEAASEVATRGGAAVQRVVGTMNEINTSARKIVDIISVIDGIAFQTNILALNAAVEAARAGEQGRGFAVVAGEVRNLAQRSASAAREIKSLIVDSVEKVENGTSLVEEAGRTMDEIVTSVERVTGIMADITAASIEQSSGIEQVNKAIIQMDEVTQQNAALVEQAAAAAESLEEQAANLAVMMSRFRLAGRGLVAVGMSYN